MFTGIIEQLGIVTKINQQQNLITLSVDVGKLKGAVRVGDSVAVSGVCLTTTSVKGKVITFDLMKETINQTSLTQLGVGSAVNLELALKAHSRLGGHFVSGHVDEVARITHVSKAKNWVAIGISYTALNAKYFVLKGSVAIDGISLTVGKVNKNYFDVYLIPYTLKVTTLGFKRKGDLVNIETDILAKYVLNKDTR